MASACLIQLPLGIGDQGAGRRTGLLKAWRVRRGLPQGCAQIGEGVQLVSAALTCLQVGLKAGLLVGLEGALAYINNTSAAGQVVEVGMAPPPLEVCNRG
jgi:hypothetical protein